MFTLYNIIAYQVAWFACVLGAANDLPSAGAALAALLTITHLALITRLQAELKLIAAAMMIGLLVDSALTWSGQIAFASGAWADGWAPYWMISLWAAFATTLNHSLRWLTTRPMLAATLGAIGGPLAYFGGARLGALQIPAPEAALPLVAVAWAGAMWTLSFVATRLRPIVVSRNIESSQDRRMGSGEVVEDVDEQRAPPLDR